MNTPDHDRLLRLLEGALPPDEAARLRDEIARSPALRHEYETLRAMRTLLQTTTRDAAEKAVKPFLADRVMRRLAPQSEPEEELFGALLRLFRPVALAGLLLILGLGAYNVSRADAYDAEPSATEAVLGLPPVTLSAAYDLDLTTPDP